MKIRKRPIKKARIEIIPMIDVIFFLLVFFMISSLAMNKTQGISVILPKVTHSPGTLQQKMVLTITHQGELFINQRPISMDQLAQQLAFEMRHDPQEVVVVQADHSVQYGLVIRAMDQARAIGVRKFALAAEPISSLENPR